MGRWLRMTTALFVVAAFAAGCAETRAPQAAQGQASAHDTEEARFDVTLWGGETLSGSLSWSEDGRVTVDGRTVSRDAIKAIQAAGKDAQQAAGVDVESLPAGYRPLEAAELSRYRRWAEEVSERDKGAESILCLDLGENIYRKDGGQVYRYHALFLILKESGRSVADLSVGYRIGRSTSRILFARSVFPDGTSRWSDATTFTESVPPQAAQFMDTRTRLISGQVPGADVGILVEYAYEYEVYNPEIKDFFFPGYVFQGEKPVLDSIIDILVPEGRPLNYTTRNMPPGAAEPVRSTRDGYDVYRWATADLPVITPEPAMPAVADVAARVECSLYFDWPTLMEPTANFQKQRIEVTPEIQALADKLTEGRETDDEKVAAIYHWVEQNINYLSIKASLSSGWAGHPATETLAAGYGDCTDVANLTASLCRAVGVDAYPVVLKTNDAGTAITDIPVPDANHAIVLVYPNGEPRFIDPTASNFRYPYFRPDDHGVKGIVHMKGEIMDIPVPPPEDNLRVSRQEITLAADGSASAVERNSYTGMYEASVRGFWRTVPPEMRARVMQQSLQSRAPGSAIEGFEMSDLEDLDAQLEMEIKYSIPSLATRIKDLYIFTLPNFKQQFPEAALDVREFDIEVPTTQMYDTRVVIHIPEGFELAGVPEPAALEGRYLRLQGSVEVSEDGRTITASEVYKRLTRKVPASDYAKYREEATKVAAWTDLKIVLERTGGAEGEEVE